METVVLFLAAFISLVLLFAQLKMFSVDATLKEILDELRRLRRAIEERSAEPAPRIAATEPRQDGTDTESPSDSRVLPKHQAVLAPWQRVPPEE